MTHPGTTSDTPLVRTMRSTARRLVSADARFSGYYRVLTTPILSEWYVRNRAPLRAARITTSTDLVIDGFPRSANTLARVLMDQIQQPPIQISSHLHTPRSILLAIRHDIPRLVLIRNPDDAVSSLLQQQPGVTPATAFRVYAHFYHTLLPLADQVVIADFPNILSDFAAIIERINSRFATDFGRREGVTAHSDTTFDHIDTRMALFDGSVGVDSAVARPSEGRLRPSDLLRDLPKGVQRKGPRPTISTTSSPPVKRMQKPTITVATTVSAELEHLAVELCERNLLQAYVHPFLTPDTALCGFRRTSRSWEDDGHHSCDAGGPTNA